MELGAHKIKNVSCLLAGGVHASERGLFLSFSQHPALVLFSFSLPSHRQAPFSSRCFHRAMLATRQLYIIGPALVNIDLRPS